MDDVTFKLEITKLEEFKKTVDNLSLCVVALERIVNWDELSIEQSCDIGSNCQRDYYRKIAKDALNSLQYYEN